MVRLSRNSSNVKSYAYDENVFELKKPTVKHKANESEINEPEKLKDDVNPEDNRVQGSSLDKRILSNAQLEAREIIETAKKDAELKAKEIIENAMKEAVSIRDEAAKEGYEQGAQVGRDEAFAENDVIFKEQIKVLLNKVKEDIIAIQEQKDSILRSQMDDLRDLTIAIAEKVINVSLKSSGEIIEKMIMAATEKSKSAQWAKLYIAQCDWELAIKTDVQVLNALKRVTDTVKLEIMEDKEAGTCIIEFPDQIIDASVDTQLSQIKMLLDKQSR